MNFAMISLDKIKVPPLQSRQEFDQEALENLRASMEELGQLQPVIVLPSPGTGSGEKNSQEQGKTFEVEQEAEGEDWDVNIDTDKDTPGSDSAEKTVSSSAESIAGEEAREAREVTEEPAENEGPEKAYKDNKDNENNENMTYELIAGERRYRALKQSENRDKIAAIVLDPDLPVEKIYEINLAENLQRQDLNELERAQGIKRYMEDNDLNKKEASRRLGIPRTTLTEWLQILDIKPEYQQAVVDEDCSLSLSHVNLAVGLGNRSGNPVLTGELIEAVMKFNLTRHETKKITKYYQRHLHLDMEEAVGAVLIDRERQKTAADLDHLLEEEKREEPAKELIKAFKRAADKLEEYMEEIGHLEPEESEALQEEFFYIYQLLKIMIPEFTEENMNEELKELLSNYKSSIKRE